MKHSHDKTFNRFGISFTTVALFHFLVTLLLGNAGGEAGFGMVRGGLEPLLTFEVFLNKACSFGFFICIDNGICILMKLKEQTVLLANS